MWNSDSIKTATISAAMLVALVTPTWADTVVLSSSDGQIRIEGELLSFENSVYTLKSTLGEFRIASNKVTCAGVACPNTIPEPSEIALIGPEFMSSGLASLLANEFRISQPGAFAGTFQPVSASSSDVFRSLQNSDAQIGLTTRRVTPTEARDIRNAGGGNPNNREQEHVVAVGNIAVVVHPSNPITAISRSDLARIYSGEISNWRFIGGPDAPIKVFHLRDDSEANLVIEENILAPSNLSLSRSVFNVSSSNVMAAQIANDPFAIGFVSKQDAGSTKILGLTESCGITNFPSAFGAKTEEYPLQRRLYIYNREDVPTQAVSDLISFMTSSEASETITSAGLVNLDISSAVRDVQDDRIRLVLDDAAEVEEFGLAREMLLDMFEWQRLSTTFRFSSGSARLDGRGVADLERLTNFLQEQRPGTEVAVVGFTDSDGAFASNQSLSLGRAERVAEAIQTSLNGTGGGVDISIKGFGELAPVACNDNLNGKRINRRVEIWIRNTSQS